jgi:SAM-dependent methyltransferase
MNRSDAARTIEYYERLGVAYDLETGVRGDEAFWRGVASRFAGGEVLELGAGSGRITRIFGALAGRIVALEIAPAMVERLVVRAGVPSVRPIVGDMTAPPLAGRFDLIYAANDPWSHLTRDRDRDAALHAVAGLLRPGARFILDALWFKPRSIEVMRRPSGDVRRRRIEAPDGSLTVVSRWRSMPASSTYVAEYSYFRDFGRVARAAFRARAWTEPELDRRFASAGLTIIRRFGDFRGNGWHPRESHALVVEATVAPAAASSGVSSPAARTLSTESGPV